MSDKNPAAVALGKRRAATMNDEQRRELSRLAHSARWAPPTKQDGRIRAQVRDTFASRIHEAVDGLFDRLRTDSKNVALVIHQDAAWVMDPQSKDFRIQQRQHPDSVIGIYGRGAARQQVLDDINEMPALATVLR